MEYHHFVTYLLNDTHNIHVFGSFIFRKLRLKSKKSLKEKVQKALPS